MNQGETTELVHVKDSTAKDRPLCGFDPGGKPMSWTTRTSSRAIATCEECLQVVLQEECSVCDSKGTISGGCKCCGKFRCRHCDIEAAADMIENRGESKPTHGGSPEP